MMFQTINRDDPMRVFLVVKNSYSTASFSDGQWAGWDIVTDKNGYSVTKITGVIASVPAGCFVETVAPGGYGKVQVWGYKSNCRGLGGTGAGTSKATAGAPAYFDTSRFACVAMAETTTPIKLNEGKFPCGVFIEPLNTAAIATQRNTSGSYEMLIRCI